MKILFFNYYYYYFFFFGGGGWGATAMNSFLNMNIIIQFSMVFKSIKVK